MNLDMKLKFNFNKRNRYKNICSIEGCNNSACGKYCNKHYHQIKRYGHIKTRTRFDKNEIIINDNVAKILLYDNNCNVIDYTIIDAEDINKISKYKISKCGNYAYANINNKNVALHRIITNTIVVDYLNIKIMFLPVDILVFVFYSNMILTKDGCLNLHKSLIVLK